MSFPRISLAIAGKKVDYHRVDLTPEQELGKNDCPVDRGELSHVCSVSQLGFWEDTHMVFTVCLKCGQPTVFVQTIPFYNEVKYHDQNKQ